MASLVMLPRNNICRAHRPRIRAYLQAPGLFHGHDRSVHIGVRDVSLLYHLRHPCSSCRFCFPSTYTQTRAPGIRFTQRRYFCQRKMAFWTNSLTGPRRTAMSISPSFSTRAPGHVWAVYPTKCTWTKYPSCAHTPTYAPWATWRQITPKRISRMCWQRSRYTQDGQK
jgi:hypothetical protein